MTPTVISLFSIIIGIFGANIIGGFIKKYDFGISGNTIAGVFGSVFLIKSFGRLGFDPISIVNSGNFNIILFLINCLVSFLGGITALVLLHKLKTLMNK
ncbi:MAG: hypothetical protein HKP59_08485 [Lutibacter sp.]|uniref:hypothetical protein n=1 Tax=Lutibacter sp. TaxID=1925666 RepID=UPI0017BC7FF6|nr:hypothetical protein [Lutibacter sp.]MBT8317651.1 hypothetical protein [Lutibacter sp.]NNJ58509.1 hypothetical protein [Lutibacter sp.]